MRLINTWESSLEIPSTFNFSKLVRMVIFSRIINFFKISNDSLMESFKKKGSLGLLGAKKLVKSSMVFDIKQS